MVKHAKPIVHARDHEHGGADPHRIHYEDVGDEGAGGGGTGLVFIAAAQEDQSVAAADSEYLDFFSIYASDTGTTAGDTIEIATPGIYEIHANGMVGYGASVIQAQMQLEINGGTSGYANTNFSTSLGGAVDPVISWSVPIPLLDWKSLDTGDTVKFQALNYGALPLEFNQWRVVIRQLG